MSWSMDVMVIFLEILLRLIINHSFPIKKAQKNSVETTCLLSGFHAYPSGKLLHAEYTAFR